jgi:DNA-binding response OmpR family regulator
MSSNDSGAEPTATVLVYSDDSSIRERVKLALGRRPAADVPRVEFIETATEPACVKHLDSGVVDLAILDGEANPAGGLGVCRAAKNEVYDCPPVLVLIARAQDAWLAKWSEADAVVSYPLDPIQLAAASARLLRTRLGRTLEGGEPAVPAIEAPAP